MRIKYGKPASPIFPFIKNRPDFKPQISLGQIFKHGRDKQEDSSSVHLILVTRTQGVDHELGLGAVSSSYSEVFLFFCWFRGEFFNKFLILRYIPVDSAIFSNSNGIIPVANLLISGIGL